MYSVVPTDIEIIICSKFEFSDDEKLIIFKQCHDSKIGGHVGIHRTIKKIKTNLTGKDKKKTL